MIAAQLRLEIRGLKVTTVSSIQDFCCSVSEETSFVDSGFSFTSLSASNERLELSVATREDWGSELLSLSAR